MTNPFSPDRTHPRAQSRGPGANDDPLGLRFDAAGFFEWRCKEGTLSWSRGTSQRLGGAPHQDLCNPECWSSYIPEDDLVGLRAETARVEAAGEDRLSYRYRFQGPDGRTLRLRMIGLCWYDDDLTLAMVRGVLLDVTGQVMESHALRASEAQLRTIFALAPDAVVVIDSRGIITGFNAAAEQMFGIGTADAIGTNVSRLMPEDIAARHDGALSLYFAGRPAQMIGRARQMTARRGDGREFPIELNVGEVKLDHATLFVAFVRDLTERAETAQRIEELREQFLRTSRLNVMGTVAAGLAHELNQPLAASSNFLAAARLMMPDRPDVGEMLQHAADQVQLAGDIIRRLRSFLAPGGAPVERIELSGLVEQARALALFGRSRFDVQVQCRTAPDADMVMADRVQLLQVLVNLIRNAAGAFAAAGSGDTIRVLSRMDGERVMISVSDNGPGFPSELLQKVDPIFRSSRTDGMGLGLTLCRRIIEGWGGVMELRNGPDGGAMIRFSVPKPIVPAED